MKWSIAFKNKKVEKQAHDLPEQILLVLQILVDNLRIYGPCTRKTLEKLWKITRPTKRHEALSFNKGEPNLRMLLGSYKIKKKNRGILCRHT